MTGIEHSPKYTQLNNEIESTSKKIRESKQKGDLATVTQEVTKLVRLRKLLKSLSVKNEETKVITKEPVESEETIPKKNSPEDIEEPEIEKVSDEQLISLHKRILGLECWIQSADKRLDVIDVTLKEREAEDVSAPEASVIHSPVSEKVSITDEVPVESCEPSTVVISTPVLPSEEPKESESRTDKTKVKKNNKRKKSTKQESPKQRLSVPLESEIDCSIFYMLNSLPKEIEAEREDNNSKVLDKEEPTSVVVKKLEKECRDLENKLEASHKAIAEVRAEYESQLVQEKKKLKSVSDSLETSNNRILQLESELNALAEKNNVVISNLENEKEESIRYSEELKQKASHLEKNVEKFQEELAKNEEKFNIQTKRVTTAEETGKKLEEIIQSLKISLNEHISIQKSLDYQVEAQKSELNEKENTVNELKMQIESTDKEMKAIRNSQEQKDVELIKAKEAAVQFSKSEVELKQSFDIVRTSLNASTTQLKASQKDLKERQKTISSMKLELSESKKKLTSEQHNVRNLEQANSDLKKEINLIRKSLDSTRKDTGQLQDVIGKLKKKCDSLETTSNEVVTQRNNVGIAVVVLTVFMAVTRLW